jgi:uncharacterized repeat protein (TIGR03803 family)
LILDATGNLYGTTFQGGVAGAGTVFKLTPTGNSWTETILHNFQDNGIDGDFPEAAVLLDSRGNVYGTTPSGGTGVDGTVFEILQ